MKKYISLTVFLLIFIVNLAKADWYQIEVKGSLIPFSKIAKVGKVSVFIVSIPGCSPCIALRKGLVSDKSIDLNKVDFYYVNLASGISQRELTKTDGYTLWRQVEKLEEFPYVYILSPATNIVSRGVFTMLQVKENITSVLNAFGKINMDGLLNDYKLTAYPRFEGNRPNKPVNQYNPKSGKNMGDDETIDAPEKEVADEQQMTTGSNHKKKENAENKFVNIEKINLGIDIGKKQERQLLIKIDSNFLNSIELYPNDDRIHIKYTKGGAFYLNMPQKKKRREELLSYFDITLSKDHKEVLISPLTGVKILSPKKQKTSGKYVVISINYEFLTIDG